MCLSVGRNCPSFGLVTRLLLSPDEGVERARAGIELSLRACSEVCKEDERCAKRD
jgi:hypothetical protein